MNRNENIIEDQMVVVANSIDDIDYDRRCFWKMSDEVYRDADGMRHSALTKLFPPNTPLDFKFNMDMKRAPTPAMELGTAIHLAVFQPDEFENRVAVDPDINKRTNAGKEEYAKFCEENLGKVIISKKELDDCYYMRDAIYRHPVGNMLGAKKGDAEISGFFKWHDTPCKFRADYLVRSKRVIFDLKTTLSGSERSFQRSVLDYNYHTAALFYMHGASQVTNEPYSDFIWIGLEKFAPYKIWLWQPERKWLEMAEGMVYRAIMTYEKCMKERYWPGPSTNVETLFAPAWMGRD